MADGEEWTTAKLKEQALKFGGTGVEQTTDLRSLIVRLLALRKHGKVIGRGNGVWVAAEGKDGSASQPGASNLHLVQGHVRDQIACQQDEAAQRLLAGGFKRSGCPARDWPQGRALASEQHHTPAETGLGVPHVASRLKSSVGLTL